MKTIDLKKTLKPFYSASASKPVLLVVPAMNALMVDGQGSPEAPAYQEAVGSLYSVAYTLKFAFKKDKAVDYPVMALESLWWADDISDFMEGRTQNWKWTALIMQPDIITPELVELARADLIKKKNPAAASKIRFESYHEGLSAQIMYFGPYADEGPTIQRLHDFIHESGHQLRGKHHEIYLSDPRRTAPEKLKTVIRQPMK